MVWAAQGIWQVQHDAEFLDNGHLLLYDNLGISSRRASSSTIRRRRLSPGRTANEKSTSFAAVFRGMAQRLPNGNTLIVDPDARRLLEVTPRKNSSGRTSVRYSIAMLRQASVSAITPSPHRRYSTDTLTFLNGVARARP